MFCLIKFTLKSGDSMSEEKEVILWNFLYALARNGQICRNFTLVKQGDYCAYVTLPKPDSLDASHDGVYVKQFRAEVENYFGLSAHIAAGRLPCMNFPQLMMKMTFLKLKRGRKILPL